ncbi:MAG: phosphatidate cytidylyltransferase [Nitrolancea sp.]
MLRQRSISAIGIVLFAAIPAFLGSYLFAAAMLFVVLIGIQEMTTVFQMAGHKPFRRTGLALGALFLIVAAFTSPDESFSWLMIVALLSTSAMILPRDSQDGLLFDWALTLTTIVYVAMPLFFAVALRNLGGDSTQSWTNTVAGWLNSPGEGLAWIGIVFTVTWLNDTAAYLFGRQFGKTKLVPRLSPGKTRVGAVSGLAVGTGVGAVAAWLFGAPISVGFACAFGFILAVAAQVGDLAESAIKRSLNVKDMGELIPGHGGMLDRIDALLFTFPTTYVLVQLIQRIGWM